MSTIAALQLVVPSSVTTTGGSSSSSISATGKVTFTSAETVSVNGVFDATYDNYVINIVSGVTAGTFLEFRLRLSGTDSTTGYDNANLRASGGLSNSNQQNYTTAYATILGNGGYTNGAQLRVYGPAEARQTAWRAATVTDDSGVSIEDWSGTHRTTSAYDGFTFDPAGAPTMTGTLVVYGFSK